MGFSVSVQSSYYTGDFDYQHMGFIVVKWSLMVFDEQEFNARFRCTQSGWWRGNVYCCCKTVAVAHSFMTFHFEAYAKANYPSRHIVLSFWKMNNVGHHCERSLVTTLLLVVVIHRKIFLMRPFFFCYIANEVKDWWFDMGYSPTGYSYMKTFIEFFFDIAVKYSVGGCLYELHQFPLFFIQSLFID